MPRRGGSCSTEASRPGPRLLAAMVVALLLGITAAAPAAAESPTVLAEDLSIDGVYVAPTRSAEVDEAAITESIRQARARGLRLVVVAPIDPQPTTPGFARRILEATDADAAIVFGLEGELEAHVIDEFSSASFRALAAGRSKADPSAAVDAFTEELLAEPDRPIPPIVGQVVMALLLFALTLGAAAVVEQLLRRVFRPRRRATVRTR